MNYKELLKSFTQKDFESDVNLHIHTNFSDGKNTPEEVLEWAKGKRYISITDHNTVGAYLFTERESNKIISGIEFDCWCGAIFLHILGYGVDVKNAKLLSLCAKTKRETEADWIRIFSARHPREVIAAIHEAGGVAILAHPACCWAIDMEGFVKKLMGYGLDGLEVFYAYHRHRRIVKFHSKETIEKIADRFNLIKTGGTDLHAI